MRLINIGILMNNRKFGEDIARALAEIYSNLSVEEIENYNKFSELDVYDVILTDRSEFMHYNSRILMVKSDSSMQPDKRYEKEGRCVGQFPRASEIFNAAVRMCEENSHTQFLRGGRRDCSLVAVRGATGGCGASAIAVTAARCISMNAQRRVLYVNAGGSDSWKCYISGASEPQRPAAELSHLIENDVLYGLESYLHVDKFGVRYLERTERCGAVLQKIAELGAFDFVIVDSPERGLGRTSGLTFDRELTVYNDKDVRTRFCGSGGAGGRSDAWAASSGGRPAGKQEGRSPEAAGGRLLLRGDARAAAPAAAHAAEPALEHGGGLASAALQSTGQADPGAADGGQEVVLVNRCTTSGRAAGRFRIPEEKTSFQTKESGIEIAMDGYFAMTIGKICDEWM